MPTQGRGAYERLVEAVDELGILANTWEVVWGGDGAITKTPRPGLERRLKPGAMGFQRFDELDAKVGGLAHSTGLQIIPSSLPRPNYTAVRGYTGLVHDLYGEDSCVLDVDDWIRRVSSLKIAATEAMPPETVADRGRRMSRLIEALPDKIRAILIASDDKQERSTKVKSLTLEIAVDIFPIVMWIERRQPQAALLEKQRIQSMQDEADRCCREEGQIFNGPGLRPKDLPLSGIENRLYAFFAFCKFFAAAIGGWCDDIELEYASRRVDPAQQNHNSGVQETAQPKRESGNAADSAAARANTAKLFPGGLPQNTDIVDLVVRLDAAKGSGRSDNDVAREFTGETKGNSRKARSLLQQIRRMRGEDRITL